MLKIGIIGIHKKEEHGQYSRIGFNYIEAIESTGLAIPYIIPCNTKYIDYHIENCDGFILPGGQDIDPEIYGEKNSGSKESIIENDKVLLDIIQRIEKTDKLLFGICRGMQLINVYFGGSLIQDIEDTEIHDDVKKENHLAHTIQLQANSILEKAFGKKEIRVNSIHHQALARLGRGVEIIGTSNDGYIESIRVPNTNILGVQWHPELITDHRILFQTIFQEYINTSLKK